MIDDADFIVVNFHQIKSVKRVIICTFIISVHKLLISMDSFYIEFDLLKLI